MQVKYAICLMCRLNILLDHEQFLSSVKFLVVRQQMQQGFGAEIAVLANFNWCWDRICIFCYHWVYIRTTCLKRSIICVIWSVLHQLKQHYVSDQSTRITWVYAGCSNAQKKVMYFTQIRFVISDILDEFMINLSRSHNRCMLNWYSSDTSHSQYHSLQVYHFKIFRLQLELI